MFKSTNRKLPPVPQHVTQPAPCCHMYHCVGGCVDIHAEEQKQDKEKKDGDQQEAG